MSHFLVIDSNGKLVSRHSGAVLVGISVNNIFNTVEEGLYFIDDLPF